MCVWGRDQGINTCMCGGGTKELIHVRRGDQGITTCVCGGGTKELIHEEEILT